METSYVVPHRRVRTEVTAKVQLALTSDAASAKASAAAGLKFKSHGAMSPVGSGRSASSEIIAVTVSPLSLMKNAKTYALSMTR